MGNKLHPELQELMDRWVRAIEGKDLDVLSRVFRCGPELAVFWSNGERNQGWDQVRRHIEADFQKELDLHMKPHDVAATELSDGAAVMTYRYDITITVEDHKETCSRQATMGVCREAEGWRVASLHVSTVPAGGAGG